MWELQKVYKLKGDEEIKSARFQNKYSIVDITSRILVKLILGIFWYYWKEYTINRHVIKHVS
jgi:hypothetical protein